MGEVAYGQKGRGRGLDGCLVQHIQLVHHKAPPTCSPTAILMLAVSTPAPAPTSTPGVLPSHLLSGRHLDAGQLLGVSAADRLQLRLKQEHGT